MPKSGKPKSKMAKGIQPTIGDILWPKNYKKSRTKTMKGKPVKHITKEDKLIQRKEKPNNVNKNKTTYASTVTSGLIHNK